MAEKDDEVTPFDDDRWVDRDADDDGTPPWLDDGEAGADSPPAADDPWAEGEDDWRDRLVDEPAFEAPPEDEEGLVDRDNDDDGVAATEREGTTPGATAGTGGPGLSDRDAPLGADRRVDRDDPEGDALNALAERELAALGEDRYPLDDDDDDEEGGDSLYGESTDEVSDEASEGASEDASEDSDGGPEAAAFPGQRRAATGTDDSMPPPWRGPVDRDDERGRPPLVDSDEEAAPFAAAAGTQGRRWPLALLAMGGLALILVAVGGYGVIAERAALREEIRDLQARLATADTAPAGARGAAGAEAAAALARIGDLEDELAALAQENSVLRARIGDLKGSLDAANGGGAAADDTWSDDLAADEPAADEPAADDAGAGGAAAAAPEEAPAPAAKPAAAQPAVSTETWFVNFSSYAELGTARRRAAELSVDAGRVVVQDAEANGRIVYRVRVVGIGSREAADAVARRLAATYQLPPLWVGRE